MTAINRRNLLQGAASAATAVLVAGGAAALARPSLALPAQALRPPGALPEREFLGACTRCGLCVRDCPPQEQLKPNTPDRGGAAAGDGGALQELNLNPLSRGMTQEGKGVARPPGRQNLMLSAWGSGMAANIAIGTPYFVARDIPCKMCEDIPCVKACPTGALDHALTDITKARMGTAVLIDQENCLNFLGLRCDVCYRVCPVIDKAITLEKQSNPRSDRHAMLLPTVHADYCTGCGMCEQSCVLQESAIKVLPMQLARGEIGAHYRKNLLQRSDAGHVGHTRSGEVVKPTEGLPSFDLPVQRLPDQPVPGDLAPLRSGAEPYNPPPIGGQPGAAP